MNGVACSSGLLQPFQDGNGSAQPADHFNGYPEIRSSMNDNQKIVAYDTRRLKDLLALRTRLIAEARIQNAAAYREATFWRRRWIDLAVERDVWRKIFPPGALYLRHATAKRNAPPVACGDRSGIDRENRMPLDDTPGVGRAKSRAASNRSWTLRTS
jgi:hypothetical protein